MLAMNCKLTSLVDGSTRPVKRSIASSKVSFSSSYFHFVPCLSLFLANVVFIPSIQSVAACISNNNSSGAINRMPVHSVIEVMLQGTHSPQRRLVPKTLQVTIFDLSSNWISSS